MHYVSAVEHDDFIHIPVRIEGDRGSLEIRRYYQLNVVSNKRLTRHRVPPAQYPWGTCRKCHEYPKALGGLSTRRRGAVYIWCR